MVDTAALLAVASDESMPLRERTGAVKELAQSRDLAAVPALREILLGGHKNLSARAAVALGNLGAVEAVPDLIQALGEHPDKGVRMLSAQALGKIGDPASADALREATSDRVEAVRTTARSSLKKMERAAVAKVRANPDQVDEAVRELATERSKGPRFNLPFVLIGLVAAGAGSYWAGGSDSLTTVAPVLVAAGVLVVAFNLAQEWRTGRKG